MLRDVRRLWIALFVTSAVACSGGGSPAPPVVTAPATSVTINGSERIGWDQPAADAVELATINYAIYVDGTRSDASGVTCASSATSVGFACTARLPLMSPGSHTLQISSFVNDGGVLESARSAGLQVTLVPTAQDVGHAKVSSQPTAEIAGRSGAADHPFEIVFEGVSDPADLAFVPDGRLLVAERKGAIAILPAGARPTSSNGSMARASIHLSERSGSGELLSLAVDPQFDQTHYVFTIGTEQSDEGATFAIVRFRESGGSFGDAAVLLDRIPASRQPHAALRFGPDGKLYAAFDAGGDPARAVDPASLNGKLLRLNPDGTTPADSPAHSPIVADGLVAPAGLDWNMSTGDIWMADRGSDGGSRLRLIGAQPPPTTGVAAAAAALGAWALPRGMAPSALAFERDDEPRMSASTMLVASIDGDALRVHLTAQTPAASEPLRVNTPTPLQALTVARDGTIYFATATAIGRLPRR
jgi:aldose sugar dehydrogenase